MAGSTCASATEYLGRLRDMVDALDASAIDALADRLFQAWQDDRLVVVFGNGGSAYTASHFVTDFLKTASVDGQRRLRAMSLVDNYGLTTALGNDIHYDQSFLYPLQAYARPGDLAIAISGSGNSPNVVHAAEWAKANSVFLAGLTGFSGGKLAELADLNIHVPSDNYGIIEDLHLSVGHMISHALVSRIAGGVAAI